MAGFRRGRGAGWLAAYLRGGSRFAGGGRERPTLIIAGVAVS